MATLALKIQAEARLRELIEEGGMPQPDEVEYGFTCIRFFWHEPKLCVIVDIDEETGTIGNSYPVRDAPGRG
jgi:hypothetical protein